MADAVMQTDSLDPPSLGGGREAEDDGSDLEGLDDARHHSRGGGGGGSSGGDFSTVDPPPPSIELSFAGAAAGKKNRFAAAVAAAVSGSRGQAGQQQQGGGGAPIRDTALLGGFAPLVSSEAPALGRVRGAKWTVTCIAQLYVDKVSVASGTLGNPRAGICLPPLLPCPLTLPPPLV